MTKPRIPMVSTPSPDDDPTGVRALLSALPAPDPMPEHLVERINASLAAEQAQRAASTSDASVSPLIATRRRRGRLVFAMAGAAATVALVTVVGNSLVTTSSNTTSAERAPAASTSNVPGAGSAAQSDAKPFGAGVSAQPNSKVPAAAATPSPNQLVDAASGAGAAVVQIRQSGTRYTKSDFVSQARTLNGTTIALTEAKLQAGLASDGGLTECLSAIGVGATQLVRADVALYEGQPAIVIVATNKGVPTAYAVGPQCSKADPAVLRPATPLP